jgi:hypothetical protein
LQLLYLNKLTTTRVNSILLLCCGGGVLLLLVVLAVLSGKRRLSLKKLFRPRRSQRLVKVGRGKRKAAHVECDREELELCRATRSSMTQRRKTGPPPYVSASRRQAGSGSST